jgi:hypothetical protein
MTTPRLGAPELALNQAVPETTVNETFYWLDAASMGGFKVLDRSLSTPPGSPAQGDCYILAGAGSGAWSTGAADDVALYIGTSWEIRTPDDGWEAWVVDEAVKVGFSSGAWGIIGTFSTASYLPTTAVLDDLADVNAPTPADGDQLVWDNVAGEWIASTPAAVGNRVVTLLVSDPNGSAITTGDGKAYYPVPSTLNGMNLVSVAAFLTTTSSSGIPTVQIHNLTQTADMLTTKLTIDAGELTSATAATPAVIDTGNDDVATGNMLRIDIDVAGTGAKGLIVEMQFA